MKKKSFDMIFLTTDDKEIKKNMLKNLKLYKIIFF